MNYYEHHIGDYAEATAHLSFVEDAAYSRLIRKYYATECPLPADLKQVQRLVGARTKEEKEAVAVILDEFFVLCEDGWHNARCDSEIDAYQAGEPEREVRKANEDNRLRKHREERARLFKVLTDAGEHAPWNIKMDELRSLVARVLGDKTATAPETKPATPETEPATAPATPATATHTPDTSNKNKPPNPPAGGKGPIEFKTWIAQIRAAGEKPIPEGDPIFQYCETVGIPSEFLTLHWQLFKRRYLDVSKRYRDWRKVFRNSVKSNWMRVWALRDGQPATLTTVGEQARREFEHREAA